MPGLVADACDRLGLGRPVLVGDDGSGYVVMAAARHTSGLARALVVIGGFACGTGRR